MPPEKAGKERLLGQEGHLPALPSAQSAGLEHCGLERAVCRQPVASRAAPMAPLEQRWESPEGPPGDSPHQNHRL